MDRIDMKHENLHKFKSLNQTLIRHMILIKYAIWMQCWNHTSQFNMIGSINIIEVTSYTHTSLNNFITPLDTSVILYRYNRYNKYNSYNNTTHSTGHLTTHSTTHSTTHFTTLFNSTHPFTTHHLDNPC